MSLDQILELKAIKEEQEQKREAVHQHWQETKKAYEEEYRQKTAWAKPVNDMTPDEYRRWRETGLELQEWIKRGRP